MFYRTSHQLKRLKAPFSIALSERFLFDVRFGITTHDDAQGTAIEVKLILSTAAEIIFISSDCLTADANTQIDKIMLA